MVGREEVIESGIVERVEGGVWDSYEGSFLDDKFGREDDECVYWGVLREKLIELNECVDEANVDSVVTALRGKQLEEDGLVSRNKVLHEVLVSGVSVSLKVDGEIRRERVRVIDFDDVNVNRFDVVRQFRFRGSVRKRADVVFFVNGLPLVVGEVKSEFKGVGSSDALFQLGVYERDVPRLFSWSLIKVAFTASEVSYAPVGGESLFPWKIGDDDSVSRDDVLGSLFAPETLFTLLRRYVFFSGGEKIVARYMQFRAGEKILERIQCGDRSSRLVWHTQGSGKSYTMLFVARALLDVDWFDRPQVFIIVDTDKLREQLSRDLEAIDFGGRRNKVVESMVELEEIISSGRSGVYVSTIQMFRDVGGSVDAVNENIVVFNDEAHRFMEKKLGTELKSALSDEFYFGFTGTPVDGDRNTFVEFSDIDSDEWDSLEDEEVSLESFYIDRYSMEDAQDDGVIREVVADVRSVDWDVSLEAVDKEFTDEYGDLTEDERRELLVDELSPADLASIDKRVDAVVGDVVEHFEAKVRPEFKGMVVTPSRRAAALYGKALKNELGDEKVAVLYTSGNKDGELLRQFHTSAKERDGLISRFKNPDDDPVMFVVCNMLLTGFDAPILKTMYLDDSLREHRLLQAIARVNRPYRNSDSGVKKELGEVVDYSGVLTDLRDAIGYKDTDVHEFAITDSDELLEQYEELFNEVIEMLDFGAESPEEIVSPVSREPSRTEFKKKASQMEGVFDELSPDSRLNEYSARHDDVMDVLTMIRVENRDDGEQSVVADAEPADIVENNVNSLSVTHESSFIVNVSDSSEVVEYDVYDSAHKLRGALAEREKRNVSYERLSQRVQDILSSWNDRVTSSEQAMELLGEVEDDMRDIDAGEEGLSEAGDALYRLFTTRYYDDFEINDVDVKMLASDICNSVKENVDMSSPYWRVKKTYKKQINKCVQEELLERGLYELYRNQDFKDDCYEYIKRNMD